MKNDVTVEYVELNKSKRGRVRRRVLDEIIARHKKYLIQKMYPFELQQYVRVLQKHSAVNHHHCDGY